VCDINIIAKQCHQQLTSLSIHINKHIKMSTHIIFIIKINSQNDSNTRLLKINSSNLLYINAVNLISIKIKQSIYQLNYHHKKINA